MRKELLEAIKKDNAKLFYRSGEWKRKRREVLDRDNNDCQMCKASGDYNKAKCVHHIKHLKDNPLLALDVGNLKSLCFACHNKMHPERFRFVKPIPKFVNKEKW